MYLLDPIPSDVLALLTALGFAGLGIFVRQGIPKANPYTAGLTVNTVVLVVFAVVAGAFVGGWSDLPLPAVLWFMAAGLSSPGISLTLHYAAIRRFGLARSGPISTGFAPLAALGLSLLVHRERPEWNVYLGTALVVTGIWLLSRPKGQAPLRWREVLLPLWAGFFWGLAANLRKVGLSYAPVSPVGVMFQNLAAVALFFLAAPFFPKGERFVWSPAALRSFLVAGGILSATYLFFFEVLGRAPVSRVTGIIGTAPFFTVLFTSIFLRKLERVTLRIYLGAISIVAGVLCLTALGG